jgi:hypothetical protein
MPGKWRWLAVVALTIPQATDAATLVTVQNGSTDLSISSARTDPNGPGVKGEANLDFSVGGVSAKLAGSAQTASQQDAATGSSALNGGQVGFDTSWKQGWAGVDLNAQQTFQNSAQDAVGSSPIYLSHNEQETQGQTATATTTLSPSKSVNIAVGASAGGSITAQRQWVAGGAPYQSRVDTKSEREFAKVTWNPLPAITVEGGTSTGTTNMAMAGSVSGGASYRAVEPEASVTVKPWEGGTVTVGAAQNVTPLDPGTLAAYAAASGRPEGADLRPDSARGIHGRIEQQLGAGVSMEAGYTNSQLLSTTVMMPAANGETPASITGGRQQTFDTSLSLGLGAIGLPGTSVSSKAVWRRSHIKDPLTGEEHRVSGQVPQEASVTLTHELPRHHLSLGLDGKLGTVTDYYQAAQETSVAQAGSVGAFVQYDPGPFSLRLSVDGLGANASQTDTFYRGVRGSSPVDHIGRTQTSGAAVGLSFSKSLDG